MALPYPTKVVLPFDIATAQDMNERHANDVALANGSGLDDGAVTADKVDVTTFPRVTSGVLSGTTTTGNKTVTLGFKPRYVSFVVQYTSDNHHAYGSGWYDGTTQSSLAICSSSVGFYSRNYNTSCVAFNIASGGTLTSTLRISGVSLNSNGFTVNVTMSASSVVIVEYTAYP